MLKCTDLESEITPENAKRNFKKVLQYHQHIKDIETIDNYVHQYYILIHETEHLMNEPYHFKRAIQNENFQNQDEGKNLFMEKKNKGRSKFLTDFYYPKRTVYQLTYYTIILKGFLFINFIFKLITFEIIKFNFNQQMSQGEHFNFLEKKIQDKQERLSIPQSSDGQDQLLDSGIQNNNIISQEQISLNPYHKINKSNVTQQLDYSSTIYSNQNSNKNMIDIDLNNQQQVSQYETINQNLTEESGMLNTKREDLSNINSYQQSKKFNEIFKKKINQLHRDEENLSGTFDQNRKSKNVFANSKATYSKYESLRPQQKSESKHDQSLLNFQDKKYFFNNQNVSTNTLGNCIQNSYQNVPRTQSLQQFKFLPNNNNNNKNVYENVSNQQIKEMDYEYNEESEEANQNQYELDLSKDYQEKIEYNNTKNIDSKEEQIQNNLDVKNEMIKEITISREKMRTNRNSLVSNNRQNQSFKQLYIQEKNEKDKLQKIINHLRQQLDDKEIEKQNMVKNYEKIIKKMENLQNLENQVQKISVQKEKVNVELSFLKDHVSYYKESKSQKPSIITQQRNFHKSHQQNNNEQRISNYLPTRQTSRQSKKRSFSLNQKKFKFQQQRGDYLQKYPITESVKRVTYQDQIVYEKGNSSNQDSKYKDIQQNFEYGI